MPIIIPSPGGTGRPPWLSTFYYDFNTCFSGSFTTGAIVADTLYAQPFFSPTDHAIDRMAIEVTTGAASGKVARVGIGSVGSNGKPQSLLLDAGELLVDAIAGVEATVAAILQARQPVFLLLVSNGTPTLRACVSTTSQEGFSTNVDVTIRSAQNAAFTYAALPADLSALTWTRSATVSRIMVRAT